MIELRDEIAAHIAAVMGVELGFSPDDCGKMMTSVLRWSEADLDQLWIHKLEGLDWSVIDLRSQPEADEFDPDGYLVGGRPVVSHGNIGTWIRTCQEQDLADTQLPGRGDLN